MANDWYSDEESLSFGDLHVVALGSIKDIGEKVEGCRLMCGGCLRHFEMHKLKRVYIEYYWGESGGVVYKDENRIICSACYLMAVDLLEQELPVCKEPDE